MWWRNLSLAAITLCGLASAATAQSSGSATLDAVRARGQLLCGTSAETQGFSFMSSTGEMQGGDADSCRQLPRPHWGMRERPASSHSRRRTASPRSNRVRWTCC